MNTPLPVLLATHDLQPRFFMLTLHPCVACSICRYVIYGPQLGLATAPPVLGAGRSGMSSMTGAALAGAGLQDMMLGTSISGMF
jgi:hypothetical protein